MSIAARIRGEIADFRAGFNRGWGDGDRADPTVVPDNALERVLVAVLELFRVVLFGFILTRPGVPLLPWGDTDAIAITLLAVAVATTIRFHRDSWIGLLLFAVILGCGAVTVYTSVASTSILLAGAALTGIIHLASGRPMVYGMVAGFAVTALFVGTLDSIPVPVEESLFSGLPPTPAQASREALLLAAFVFVAGMQHLMRAESERQKERAVVAEAARDAAVTIERARIARELHDVVSHHVTGMTLQAEAAATTGDADALRKVAASGREALTELRRMLGVLRRPDEAGDADAAARPSTEPQPRLADLDGLARRATAGTEVVVRREGQVRPLPAGVELCAYRLVQEAMTNSAKHSDASRVTVTITYGSDELIVDVIDDGRPLALARIGGGGHGLVGMRERVALLDGELSTGTRPDGAGYQVVVRLPLQG